MDKGLRLARERKGVTAIADACGVTTQAVSQWKRIPPRHVKAVSNLTGTPPHLLRPDIVPAPQRAA